MYKKFVTSDIMDILETRDIFIFKVCKFVGMSNLEVELELYKKIPDEKKNMLASNLVRNVIAKMFSEKFNTIYSNILHNKILPDNFHELLKYFDFSKLDLINMLAPLCLDFNMELDRTKLITKNTTEYTESLTVLLNESLNTRYNDVLKEFMNRVGVSKIPDDMISDRHVQKVQKPYIFEVKKLKN